MRNILLPPEQEFWPGGAGVSARAARVPPGHPSPATVVTLPEEETQRRKDATNPEWPIAHVVLHGQSRDQFMARHKANHAQLVYAPDAETADKALAAKVAMFERIGITVNLTGDVNL